MIKIGFVGTENDMRLRLELLKKTYGSNNVHVLMGHDSVYNLNTIDTVEKLIENTDVIFFGREAINNQTLLYHTIKEANKVFLDNDYFLPPGLVSKCKAYHEEAGNQVAFNISSYLHIFPQINNLIENPRHIHFQSIGTYNDILKKTYELVVLGCCFLGYTNVRSAFYILPQSEGNPVSVSISMHNLDGYYFHLSVSSSKTKEDQFVAVNETEAINQTVETNGIFSSSEILKNQLNSLFNNSVLGSPDIALAVSKIMERLTEIVHKKAYLSLNE